MSLKSNLIVGLMALKENHASRFLIESSSLIFSNFFVFPAGSRHLVL
ncbi:hypothetical protein ACB092_04G093600 [Castanea dentata]